MKPYLIFCTLLCVTSARAQIKHNAMHIIIYSDPVKEDLYGMDGEEFMYADFVNQKAVNMLPPFAGQMDMPTMYRQAVGEQETSKNNFNLMVSMFKNETVKQTAPQTSVYSRYKIQLGDQTTLICHSGRFFPPPIHVEWTKNGVNVTDSATFSQLYPNEDYSYNQFSHLTITPQEGDIYTCTVKHSALQFPDTKTWEVDVKLPSNASFVFFWVSLVLGLLGVAVGIFFFIKGNLCN